MARKNKKPIVSSAPSSASSSSSSSSDDEDTAPTPPPPSSASALKPPRPSKPVSSSEEEEDDEEGSSSESEGSPPPPPPKKPPVVTSAPPSKKPLVTSPTRTKKPTPITSAPPPSTPAQPSDPDSESNSEPPPPAIAPEKSKKAEKKRKSPDTQLFVRVWTTDDITVLMKGVVGFHEKHGRGPTTPEYDALLGMVKHQLHSEFTTSQVMTKIRNIKKKYEANLAKEKEVFSNEHDKLVYDLSKKVWGNLKVPKGEVGDEAGEEGNRKPQKLGSITASLTKKKKNSNVVSRETVADGRSDDFAGLNWAVKLIMQEFADGNLNTQGTLEQGLTILKPEVLSAFGESWRNLNFEEFLVMNKRIQLKSNIVKAVEKALKSAGS